LIRSLKTQMELGSPEALKGVVATGLGFAIVSRAVADKEKQLGELVSHSARSAAQAQPVPGSPKDRFQSRLARLSSTLPAAS
jgi:hypothetical protein